jgi:hypothetical protein
MPLAHAAGGNGFLNLIAHVLRLRIIRHRGAYAADLRGGFACLFYRPQSLWRFLALA